MRRTQAPESSCAYGTAHSSNRKKQESRARPIISLDAAMKIFFHFQHQRRGASEFFRWPLRVRIVFAVLISVLLAAGCGKPPSEGTTPPISESWNPPKDGTNIVILYSSVQGGKGYKFEVPRARIEKLADWTPASNTIPLAPQQAARLALAWYRSLHPTITNLQASSISLQRIFRYETKWAYHVFLVPPEGAGPFQEPKDSMRTAVVLLDGTVVDPVSDPDTNRWPKIHL